MHVILAITQNFQRWGLGHLFEWLPDTATRTSWQWRTRNLTVLLNWVLFFLLSFYPRSLTHQLITLFNFMQVDLYSGALFINQALKWDIYGSMMALLAMTAVFTVTGGLAAVIYTDTLQLFIMLGGASFVMVKGELSEESLLVMGCTSGNTCQY